MATPDCLTSSKKFPPASPPAELPEPARNFFVWFVVQTTLAEAGSTQATLEAFLGRVRAQAASNLNEADFESFGVPSAALSGVLFLQDAELDRYIAQPDIRRRGGVDEAREPTAALCIDDCSEGQFVEVESGQERPWFGQIAQIRDGELPLAVRWLAAVPPRLLPEALGGSTLYTFRGGAHYVGLESIRQADDELFHAADVELPAAGGGRGGLKELFCHHQACGCGVGFGARGAGRREAAGGLALASVTAQATGPACKWDAYVWADCVSEKMQPVGFEYITCRLFATSSTGGSPRLLVEGRWEGRCSCKGRLCHARCLQGECASKLINRGEMVCRLYVRSSSAKRGSGVFALHPIFKGQLVCEYVGQLVSREDAKKREKEYLRMGLFYLHDVHGSDTQGGDEAFTIDPTKCGNVGRMMNHSCSPNLTTIEFPVAAAKDSDDTVTFPRVPRVGFMAAKDIEAGSELFLDYSPGRSGSELKKVVKCFCGAKACKGYLF